MYTISSLKNQIYYFFFIWQTENDEITQEKHFFQDDGKSSQTIMRLSSLTEANMDVFITTNSFTA